MKIKAITSFLESIAPRAYQEDYDNVGLLVGSPEQEISKVLITLDATEAVVEEAIAKNCELIIAHHPIVFRGLKKLNGANYVERTVIKAIKHDVAIYAMHTNLDNVNRGVNRKLAEKIGLKNLRILAPKSHTLLKLVTFVPKADTNSVLESLHDAGAGHIGDYSHCSFQLEGQGSFIPNEQADPHIGQANELEKVAETRLELILPAPLKHKVVNALKKTHPYDEVAYYLHPLENVDQSVGSGMIGELDQTMDGPDFLHHLKASLNLKCIRHTAIIDKKVARVALCGGAGSFLLNAAKAQGAQAFVSADFKYHEFFDAEDQLMIADVGHYESEVSTKELISDLIKEKFTTFAVNLSEVDTNPIRYFC